MKKNTKLCSIFMAVLMLLSAIPIAASAATEGDFKYTVENNEATITAYIGHDYLVCIPETLGGYPVTTIDSYAFSTITWNPSDPEQDSLYINQSRFNLSTVVIPSTVKTIKASAFMPIKNFTNNPLVPSLLKYTGDLDVYIPSSVEYIDPAAFVCAKFFDDDPIPAEDEIKVNIFYEGSAAELNEIYDYAGARVDWTFDEISIFEVNIEVYTKNTFTYNTRYNAGCHNWVITEETSATCTKDGTTKSVCSICGEEKTEVTQTANGHSHKTVVTPPTCTTLGYTTYTCECGDSYQNNLTEPTGHQDTDSNTVCDNCGENLDSDTDLSCWQKIVQAFQKFFDWIKNLFNFNK